MLVLAGTLTIDPAAKAAVADAIRAITAETRREPGCVQYCFSFDLDDAASVHVFECWESEATWQAHMASGHVGAFGAAVGGFMRGADLQRYEVGKVSALLPVEP